MTHNFSRQKYREIPLSSLMVFSMIYTCLVSWSYGKSYLLYSGLSILGILIAFGVFSTHVFPKCSKPEFICILIIFFTTIMGFLNSGVVSSFQVNASVLMPFVIAYFNIQYKNLKKQIIIVAILNLLISLFLTTGLILNSNSMAFLVYSGCSAGFIWFVLENKLRGKILAGVYLLISAGVLLEVGSRNAGIVLMICFVLLLVPKYFYQAPVFYRTVYILAILSTVFASNVMEYIFNNMNIMDVLLEFTTSFSDKAWKMEGHLDILLYAQMKFSQSGIFEKIFGEGVRLHHCHNLFYQCLFFYGYVGTIMLYGLFGYIFEQGFKLYRIHGNKLTLACCIVLLGHFLMQIGEVYMFGSETMCLIALVPMGIILQQKRTCIETY